MGEKDFSHLSFEDAYAKLEKIIEQLETNSLPLEESLTLFEEGQTLSAYCQQLLDKAELRVSELVGGQIVSQAKATLEPTPEPPPSAQPVDSSTDTIAQAEQPAVPLAKADAESKVEVDEAKDSASKETSSAKIDNPAQTA